MTETDEATTVETQPPTNPKERARDNITGLGITCQGHEWLLPYAQTAKALDTTRDRMYQAIMTIHKVSLRDVWSTAWVLLNWNYRLTPKESSALVYAFNQTELIDAVILTTIGTDTRFEVGYSQWLRSALYANGLDPEKVPGEYLGEVIQHLLSTNRIAPASEMVSFQVADKTRREILSL